MDNVKKRCINEDYLDLYTLCFLLNKDSREYKNISEFRNKIIEEIKDESCKLKFEPEIFSFCGPINQRHIFSQIYEKEIGLNNDKISISLNLHGINIPIYYFLIQTAHAHYLYLKMKMNLFLIISFQW